MEFNTFEYDFEPRRITYEDMVNLNNQLNNKGDNVTVGNKELVEAIAEGIIVANTKPTKWRKVGTFLYDKKGPWTGVIINSDESYYSTIYAKSEKKLNKMFRAPEYRDCSMKVYKYSYTYKEARNFTKSRG